MYDNVSKLREVQLELLKEFKRVCEEHDLKWYAFFGTLLGCVRHEGYLPWDDDVDVAMPVADYNKLCTHKEWFGDGFFLQTPLDEGLLRLTKLRKNGTTAFRAPFLICLKNGGHQGIPIDIIPLADIPGTECCFTSTIMGPKHSAVYMKDWLEPAGEMKFENLTLRVPANPRKVLKEAYGDWDWPNGAMAPRPVFWFFDTEHGHEYYYKRYTGMLEGIEGKKIFLFGAADSLRIWLERFGLRRQVVCAFDNDPGKWGKKMYDVEIQDPSKIPELLDDNSRLIVVSIWHQEIGRQLEKMGIDDYYVYLDRYYDDKVGNKVIRREDTSDGNSKLPKWDN